MAKKGKKKALGISSPSAKPAGAAELLNQACVLHQEGNLAAAEQKYRQALEADASLQNAWRNLGAMLRQQGRQQEGRHCTEQALKLNGNDASLWGNYGNVLRDLGELDGSLQAFQTGLQHSPGNRGLLHGQAITLARLGRHKQVIELLAPLVEQALPQGGSNAIADLLLELGNAHHELGDMEQALTHWQRGSLGAEGEKRLMIGLNTAQVLCDRKKYQEAQTICNGLEPLFPENANLFYAQGVIARGLGNLQLAYSLFEKALALEPDYTVCLNTFGLMLRDIGRSHQARECFEKALACDPNFGPAMNNLGSVLKDVARYKEALVWLRKGAETMDKNPAAHSNVLFTLVGYELEPAQQRYEEAQKFAAKAIATHPVRFERYRDRIPDPDPERRLKVGLMSPDFCRHAVSYFIEPLLDNWDRKQLEIFLYSNGEVRDDYTIRLQTKADQWREIRLLNQEEVIAMMLRDEIDILIDLAGHTAGNRLPLLAGKPAPIQATYLGYYGTTGLDQVDYWLTDSVLHPPELDAEDPCSEERWRLDRPYVSYRPIATAPEVCAPPCVNNKWIQFGSFNQSRKITQQTAENWMAALNAVPNSKLILKSRNLGEETEQKRIKELFQGLGLKEERLVLHGHSQTVEQHLAAYSLLDIALDTFPYTGCTTSADALWMGVPVLTVAGKSMVSRQAAAVLTAAGKSEWICNNQEELITKAQQLAANPDELLQLRHKQRKEVEKSELLNHISLANEMQKTFRLWWKRWLEKEGWGVSNKSWSEACITKPVAAIQPMKPDKFWQLSQRTQQSVALWLGDLTESKENEWQNRGYEIIKMNKLNLWRGEMPNLFKQQQQGRKILAVWQNANEKEAKEQQTWWKLVYPQLVLEQQN